MANDRWFVRDRERGTYVIVGACYNCVKTNSKRGGRIERDNAKTGNRNVYLTPVVEVRADMVVK